LFTRPETKDKKPKDPKEALRGLGPVSQQAIDDYFWGRTFGRVEGKEMVWKYGNPWRYPMDEFNQLKTIILTVFAVEEFKRNSVNTTPADIATALNIPEVQKEQNKKVSQGMANFFKGTAT
jgi:hypothetical protein